MCTTGRILADIGGEVLFIVITGGEAPITAVTGGATLIIPFIHPGIGMLDLEAIGDSDIITGIHTIIMDPGTHLLGTAITGIAITTAIIDPGPTHITPGAGGITAGLITGRRT